MTLFCQDGYSKTCTKAIVGEVGDVTLCESLSRSVYGTMFLGLCGEMLGAV